MKQKQPRIVVCEKCGKRFEARTYHQKFCSRACADRMKIMRMEQERRVKREERIANAPVRFCEICGGELPSNCTSAKRFCDECNADRRRRRRKGRHKRKANTYSCVLCGAKCKTLGNNAKYCDDCRKRNQHNANVEFLGKRDGRRVYHKECAECCLPFNTFDDTQTICAPCKKGKRAKTKPKEETPPPPLTIAEQMREIEEYNREHGTNLSYGKYMAMKRAKP